jgi:hypothetical protein
MHNCNPGDFTSIVVLKLINEADDLALVSSDGSEKHQFLLSLNGLELIFSSSLISSIGRSACKNALTVTKTSSGSVHSGMVDGG